MRVTFRHQQKKLDNDNDDDRSKKNENYRIDFFFFKSIQQFYSNSKLFRPDIDGVCLF